MAERRFDDDSQDAQSTVLHVRVGSGEAPDQYTLAAVEGPDAGKRWVLDGATPSRTLFGASPAWFGSPANQ